MFIASIIFACLTAIAVSAWIIVRKRNASITEKITSARVAEKKEISSRSSHSWDDDDKEFSTYSTIRTFWFKVASIGLACVTVLLLTGASISIVSTKSVGVVTEFGSPAGTLQNGWNWKLPWQDVTELDGSIQTDKYAKKDDSCTDVRIGNGSTACVDNSIRWRIVQEQGDSLYRDYREFDTIRDSLVTRELKAALGEIFSSYDPLGTEVQGGKDASLDSLSNKATERLRAKIGAQAEILNVSIPLIHYDQGTQDKINAYQAEVANTRIAEQRQKTSEAAATANKNLSASVSNDPNVLVSKCLDTLDDMVRANQSVPAGFSCWPGSGSALVVPSAAK